MSEGQKVPGPTESSCGGKAAAFCVLFLTLDHQDLLVQTHWFRPGLFRPAAFLAFIPVGV